MMKYRYFLLVALLPVYLQGCKKEAFNLSPLASLKVVNATPGLAQADINFTNLKGLYAAISSNGTGVYYGSNMSFGVNAGPTVPITIVPDADTNTVAFSGNFKFVSGGVYSLYLAGQLGAVDTILVREHYPVHADSSCGIRFINLSHDCPPVYVTLAATNDVSEFGILAYKQVSAFKTYPSPAAVASYDFQVFDAATKTMLAEYVINTPYFHNATLVLNGEVGGTGSYPLGIVEVDNF